MTDSLNKLFAEPIAEFFNLFGEKETFTLFLAQDREKIFNEFFEAEKGFNGNKLAFLDKGIKSSPYQSQVENYLEHLNLVPNLAISGAKVYPDIGEMPDIDEQGLDFLHPDIKQACICLGGTAEGPFKASWFGRNALDKAEFWSCTKIIPILNLISSFQTDIDGCVIADEENSYNLEEVLEDIVTYGGKIGSSNALGATFKTFQTYEGLETWMKQITGNNYMEFKGLYGEEPFMVSPVIKKEGEVILRAAKEIKQRETQPGSNSVTAYDLTRLMSMVGWGDRLPQGAKIPGISSDNLKPFIRSFSKDTARYVDVALEKLGLQNSINSPVILSKMGFGYTSDRRRTELAYTCFVQFYYRDKVKSLAMTLRAASSLGDFDKEAVIADARMAAEVTEILRRLVEDELTINN
jgi:hypothetical protein